MKERQYNQKLSPKLAAEGIRIIMQNANSLLDDAELLFQNERYERSFTLAILSIEESGKIPILRSILLEDDQKELSKLWKNFRTHSEKNWGMLFLSIPIDKNTKLENFKPLFDNSTTQGQEFDNLKQLSIYTELFKNKKWNSPKEIISKELAQNTLKTSRLLVRKDSMAMNTEHELELWIKHLKPVWKTSLDLMKEALIKCYKEADRLGILSGTEKADDYIKYI